MDGLAIALDTGFQEDPSLVVGVRFVARDRSVVMEVLVCSEARHILEACMEHVDTGERRSAMSGDGRTVWELRLTRLKSQLSRVRVSQSPDLGPGGRGEEKVVIKADVDPVSLRREAEDALARYDSIVGPGDC